MEKGKVFLLFLFTMLILLSFQVYAQINSIGEKISENVEKTRTKWDYLSEEWKTILLKNKIVSDLDSFFKEINFIFVILFGESYSLSLMQFFIVIFWTYFLFQISKILSSFTPLSSGISFVISLLLTIIIAQLQILKKIASIFVWIIFSPDAGWARILIFILVILLLATLYRILAKLGWQYKLKKEKKEKEKERETMVLFGKYVRDFGKIMSGE